LPGLRIGIDIIEVSRIQQAIACWHGSFLERIYTEAELDGCRNITSSLAARFAAKEAVKKAFGSDAKGLRWREIEILSNDDGVPLVQLHGRAQTRAREIGITGFSISLSHTRQHAIAFVIG